MLAVMLYHANRLLPGGYVGVDIFFVLSGYLITRILVQEVEHTGTIDFGAFFLRRAARLVPALLLMLVITVGAYYWLLPGLRQITLLDAAAAVFYTMDFSALVPGNEGPFLHTWSLAIEVQFYLVWPLAVLMFAKIGRATAAAIMLSTWLAITIARDFTLARHAGLIAYYTPLHATGLELGAALAFMPRLRVWASTGPTIFAVLVWFWAIPNEYWMISVAEVAAAFTISNPPKFIMFRPLTWVGKISYGLYLWHLPLWYLPYLLKVPHPWAVMFVGSFALAALSYYGVERRIIVWAAASKRSEHRRLKDVDDHRVPGDGDRRHQVAFDENK